MNRNHLGRSLLFVMAVLLSISGCGQATEPTPVPSSTPSGTPTPLPSATATKSPTVDMAATEAALAATVEARVAADLTATANIVAVQTVAAATVEARIVADLTATAAAHPTATLTATPSATPEPTAPPTAVPVTPRPTATLVPAITLTLSNMRYETWGRPVLGCLAFDDSDPVRKFNLEVTLQNDTDATIEDWYPVFVSSALNELYTCFYVYSEEGFPVVPSGESRTVTFASFCEQNEYVAGMYVVINDVEFIRCFSPDGALVACGEEE